LLLLLLILLLLDNMVKTLTRSDKGDDASMLQEKLQQNMSICACEMTCAKMKCFGKDDNP